MKLSVEIMANLLAQEDAQIIFPQLKLNVVEMMELQCYQTLRKIQEIVRDDSFDDPECFERIERIICEFESIGSDSGSRHDFG